MVQATSPQPRKDCHLGSHACKSCHQSKGSNPDELEGDTWTSRGWKGPQASKPPQTRVNTRNQPWDPQGSHHMKAQAKVGPQGVGRPHRSVEPTLCRLILTFHVVTPGWLLVHSRGAHGILPKCPMPINRREGTNFLPNSLSNSSLSLGFHG
jgi:hypothetical protein